MDVDIYAYIEKIIHGAGGFIVHEDREFVSHNRSREYSIAAWTIRCLANTESEEAGKVLQAIQEKRNQLQTESAEVH